MKAIRIENDLITAYGDGNVRGEPMLEAVPPERQRYDGSAIIDIADVTAFFIDDAGRKHITQADPAWQALTCAWDDSIVNDAGTWRIRTVTDALTTAKALGKVRVGRAAEVARQAYITPGDGKAAIYAIKRDEAQRWQAAVDNAETPVLADYPWISARATRLTVTGQSVADEWNAKAAAWETAGRAIEDAYEAAVESIDALTDAATVDADIDTIIDAIVWA